MQSPEMVKSQSSSFLPLTLNLLFPAHAFLQQTFSEAQDVPCQVPGTERKSRIKRDCELHKGGPHSIFFTALFPVPDTEPGTQLEL